MYRFHSSVHVRYRHLSFWLGRSVPFLPLPRSPRATARRFLRSLLWCETHAPFEAGALVRTYELDERADTLTLSSPSFLFSSSFSSEERADLRFLVPPDADLPSRAVPFPSTLLVLSPPSPRALALLESALFD